MEDFPSATRAIWQFGNLSYLQLNAILIDMAKNHFPPRTGFGLVPIPAVDLLIGL